MDCVGKIRTIGDAYARSFSMSSRVLVQKIGISTVRFVSGLRGITVAQQLEWRNADKSEEESEMKAIKIDWLPCRFICLGGWMLCYSGPRSVEGTRR